MPFVGIVRGTYLNFKVNQEFLGIADILVCSNQNSNSELHVKKIQKKRKSGGRQKVQIANQGVDIKLKNLSKQVQKAYADFAAMDPRFKILYLVPHDNQVILEPSVFGWYTPGLHKAAGPLEVASILPADIREPFSSREQILMFRLFRRIWPKITPIQLDALFASVDLLKHYPFRVLISNDPEIAREIDLFISKSGLLCLHVSSEKSIGRIPVQEFEVSKLLEYCNDVVNKLAMEAEYFDFVRNARDVMLPKKLRKTLVHPLSLGQHNITSPNEMALMAFGWTFNRVAPVSQPLSYGCRDSEHYVNRICQSADAVMTARSKLLKNLQPGLQDYRYIIAVQSMFWGNFVNWREQISKVDKMDRPAFNRAYTSIVQATTYFDTFKIDDPNELQNDKIFRAIKAQQASDARSFTAGLTALATASLAPVLRLEPKLNQVRGDLVNLTQCVRANGCHSEWKQSRLTSRLGEKMRLLINPRFLKRIDKRERGQIEGMKLVTDLPLELMYSGELPLCMRFDVSRVGVMPGNSFMATCLMPPIIIPMSAFHEILVIRSFQQDDPLRNILEESLSQIPPPSSDFQIKIRFVDVTNENEFVDVLEGYSGAMMIFDGHGDYDSAISAGMIVIGGKKIDAWQLKNRCTVPPIVIFSACDTQPLDGGHGSSATAAFALGAHTVLGTTLPIDGRTAGAFIGRLILRINEFLPLIVKRPMIVTWREIISGLLRMSHVTEVMFALKKNAGPKYRSIYFDQVQLKANIAINNRNPDWYFEFLLELSSHVGHPIEILKQDIKKWASMTDSMKYVQLGNPESIVIEDESPDKILGRAFGEIEH